MPDRVVIGGGMAQAGALFLDPIRAHITEAGVGLSLSADDIVLAEHGNDVGLLGGYALGTNAFLSDIGSHGIVITTQPLLPPSPGCGVSKRRPVVAQISIRIGSRRYLRGQNGFLFSLHRSVPWGHERQIGHPKVWDFDDAPNLLSLTTRSLSRSC